MKSTRMQRLDSEIRRAVAEIIAGPLRIKEPAIGGIVSVTEADVAPDLKTAKVYISILAADEASKRRSFSALRANAGFVRHELARIMRVRTVPTIAFLEDGSMEYGSRMDALLAGLEKGDRK